MYKLNSLKVSNFRSFAKEQKIEFNTDITAVYGANASGKSNISRSLNFMFWFMSKECLNPDFAHIVVEYENGVVKSKHQFPTKNLARTFVKTMGKNFRYKGQNKKAS